MKRMIKFIIGIVALGCTITSHGQLSMTLEDAILRGLENNYQIRISEQEQEIVKNNNSWGTVGRYPSVTLGIGQNNRYDNAESNIEGVDRNKYTSNSVYPYVNARWNIFGGFGGWIAKDKLQFLEEYSEGFATIIVENTIQAIVLAYYKVLLEEEKLKVMGEVKQLSSDRYDYVLARKQLGSVVTYDVLQAKNAFLSDSTYYLLQALEVKNARRNLHFLLAEDPSIQYELITEFDVQKHELDYDTLRDQMYSSNRTLMNQYINQEILKKEIAYQKSTVYPNLALNAGVDQFNSRIKYVDQDANYSDSYDFYANFTLSFNLTNGGNTRRAIQNARIDEQIGQLTIAEMRQTMANQLVFLHDLYEVRKQLFDVELVRIESASLNMEISNEKFKAGAINSFNYRDVQLIYLNAAVARLEAIYDLVETYVDLLRITGGIITEY